MNVKIGRVNIGAFVAHDLQSVLLCFTSYGTSDCPIASFTVNSLRPEHLREMANGLNVLASQIEAMQDSAREAVQSAIESAA